MEIFGGVVGVLGGLVIAGLAVVAVVLGRRAIFASLVDVEVRLARAGDDGWRVGMRVRNSGCLTCLRGEL